MVVDVEHFTPLRAVIGGALIGVSAAWFFLAHARIAGISGLLGQMVTAIVNPPVTKRAQLPLTVAFLGGLVGICPGPAVVLAGLANRAGLVFLSAMLTGMLVYSLIQRDKSPR